MVFWLIIALAILLALSLVLRALSGARDAGLTGAASDMAVYKDQLAEVERDRARGLIAEAEAEAVRIEVARRLLAADKRGAEKRATRSGHAFGIAVAAVILAAAVPLYLWIGAAGYGDLPLKERLADLETAAATRPTQAEAEEAARPNLPPAPLPDPAFEELVERLRTAVAQRPGDAQGLALLAQNEARLGNLSAAIDAQRALIEAKGDAATLADRLRLLDVMIYATGGYVSPEAEVELERLLADAPQAAAARYYEGLLYVQTGRADRAFPIWRQLLEQSPPDAPWVPVIRAGIAEVARSAGVRYDPPPPPADAPRGPTAADIDAASDMTAADRQAMIEGMVSGLADRLASEGGPPQDWARLITALGVLGRTAEAREIAAEAEAVFEGEAEALAQIAAARRSAGIAE